MSQSAKNVHSGAEVCVCVCVCVFTQELNQWLRPTLESQNERQCTLGTPDPHRSHAHTGAVNDSLPSVNRTPLGD